MWTIVEIERKRNALFRLSVVWDKDGPNEIELEGLTLQIPPEGPARDAALARFRQEIDATRNAILAVPKPESETDLAALLQMELDTSTPPPPRPERQEEPEDEDDDEDDEEDDDEDDESEDD